MQEIYQKDGAEPSRTVTADPFKTLLILIVAGIIITMAVVVMKYAQHAALRQSQSDTPIKGVLVTNRQGDVVEHDAMAGKKVCFGQNLLLLLPYAETAEARHKLQVAERMTLKTSIGVVELAAVGDGRMVGVIK